MSFLYLSRLMRKPTICICKNNDADQLISEQSLCLRYTNSTLLLLKIKLFTYSFCFAPFLFSSILCQQNEMVWTRRAQQRLDCSSTQAKHIGETLDSVSTVFNEIAQHPPHTLFAECNWSIGHPR